MKTPIHKAKLRCYEVHGSREAKGRPYRENVTLRIVAPSFHDAIVNFVECYPDVEITLAKYDGPVDVLIGCEPEGELQ